MAEALELTEAVKPSLLRQIVDAADMLDDDGKREVLRRIRMQNGLQLAKKADEMSEGKTKEYLTEEEIADIVSEDRRRHYQE